MKRNTHPTQDSDERDIKKIKITIESHIERKVHEITEAGEEILSLCVQMHFFCLINQI
jgi:hypothetical protein